MPMVDDSAVSFLRKCGKKIRQNMQVPKILVAAKMPKSLRSAEFVNVRPTKAPIVVTLPIVSGYANSFISFSASEE